MTLPTGLNPEQIVEILVLTEDGTAKCSYGSGYQLAGGLVATARHVVRGKRDRPLADGLTIQVRCSARQSVSTSAVAIGHVRWEGEAIDLALLELEWPGAAPDWPLATPTLGDVPVAARRLTYEALGYPYSKEVTLANADKLRDSQAANGQVSAQDNLKTGALQLRTGVAAGIDQWEGFSGAPVFVNKFLVGVVTQDDAGDLRACRWSIALGEGPRVDVDSTEPEASARALRGLLASHGIDPRTLPARRQPIYRQTIEVLRPPGGLLDREDEIGDLTAFATADPNGELTRPYLDWTGAPGAGATRLAAEFAAVPPPGVDLIAFFATRGVAGQTTEFWTHTCDQLAAVLDDPPLAPGPADAPRFAGLWQQAADQARATGRPLMLLIEGLDSDGPLRPMIADSIPENGDATARIAVFRRDQPGLRLPTSHPLRSASACTRRDLRPLDIARERRAADRAQLDRLLADHPQVATILDLIAIAGPLAGPELGSLLGGASAPDADPLAAVRQLKEVSDGLSQAVDAGVLRAEPADAERFDFAEDAVRRMIAERWVPGTADAYRHVILAWAERYAARGWPDDTPPYLMTGYARLLSGAAAQTPDAAAALAGLATPERTAAVRRAAGDAAALRELTLVLDRMASSAPPDLPAMCRLALRREQLVRSQSFAPVSLIDAHARLGHWSRARELAEQLQMPMDRVSAFVQVASAAQEAGRDRFADMAFEQALQSCAALEPSAWPQRTSALQTISQATAASSRLIDPDAVVEVFPDPSTAVMSLIGFVVSYARAGHPVWASRFVIRAAALADSVPTTPEAPAHDESPAATGDATGNRFTDVATRQKAFQDHYNAVQTVFTGALLLARMAGIVGEDGAGEDSLTTLRRQVSAAAKAIEAIPDPSLRRTALGELGSAAARAGHPEIVAEPIATAVAAAGAIVDPAARAWALCALSPALSLDVRGAGELVRTTAQQLGGLIVRRRGPLRARGSFRRPRPAEATLRCCSPPPARTRSNSSHRGRPPAGRRCWRPWPSRRRPADGPVRSMSSAPGAPTRERGPARTPRSPRPPSTPATLCSRRRRWRRSETRSSASTRGCG